MAFEFRRPRAFAFLARFSGRVIRIAVIVLRLDAEVRSFRARVILPGVASLAPAQLRSPASPTASGGSMRHVPVAPSLAFPRRRPVPRGPRELRRLPCQPCHGGPRRAHAAPPPSSLCRAAICTMGTAPYRASLCSSMNCCRTPRWLLGTTLNSRRLDVEEASRKPFRTYRLNAAPRMPGNASGFMPDLMISRTDRVYGSIFARGHRRRTASINSTILGSEAGILSISTRPKS